MKPLSKNLVKYTCIYLLLMFTSILLGWLSDTLAYVVFFTSAIFLSAAIVYETWKMSKPLKEVTYPTPDAIPSQNEMEHLTNEIEKAISEKSHSTYLTSRLRQILVRRISLRSGIDAASLKAENPEDLKKLGYDDLVHLLNEENVFPKTRKQRIQLLNEILDHLERS
jgi:hypothetical protein